MIFLIAGARSWTIKATGDQVYYLIMTQSLVEDFDLDVKNNYHVESYQDFYLINDFGVLINKHAKLVKRGDEILLYPIHSWGIPLLLAPFYLLFGWKATVVTIIFFTTLTALGIYIIAYKMTGQLYIALVIWLVMIFSLPLLAMSSQIYPEMVTSTILVWSFLFLSTWKGQLWQGLILGGLIGYLPLLHSRYLAPMFLLLVFLVFITWQTRLSYRTLIVPFLVSFSLLAFQMTLSYIQFDSFSPIAVYNGTSHSIAAADWGGFPRRYVLWLVDQEQGLLPYAPVYILAIIGFGQMLRSRTERWLALLSLLLFTSVHLPICMKDFLGWQFPARFLSAVVPLLVVPLSHILSSKQQLLRYTFYLLAILSSYLAFYGVNHPGLLLNNNTSQGKIFVELSNNYLDLTRYLPSFISSNRQFEEEDFNHRIGHLIKNNNASQKFAWGTNNQDQPGYLQFGPYNTMKTGFYEACFYLRMGNNINSDPIGWYAVTTPTLDNTDYIFLTVNFLVKSEQYHDTFTPYCLKFFTYGTWPLEFIVYYDGNGFLISDRVDIREIEPTDRISQPELPYRRYLGKILPGQVGQIVRDRKALAGYVRWASQETESGYISYGPYAQLLNGQYKACFRLRGIASNETTVVSKVDIITSLTESKEIIILAEKEITNETISPTDYQLFCLPFKVSDKSMPMEFRVYHTVGTSIWLDYIDVRLTN